MPDRSLIADIEEAALAATDRFDLWAQLARVRGARRVAEVGVWRGAFAARLLRAAPEIESYLLIDPWRPLPSWNKPLNVGREEFDAAKGEALAATAFAASRVKVMQGTTAEVADRIPDHSLELVYVDGDHTLRGITIDLITLLNKVAPAGYLGGDDYMRDPWHHGPRYEPSLVAPYARYFAEAKGLPFFALPFQQFLIVKEDVGFSFTNLSGAATREEVGLPSPSATPKEGRNWPQRRRRLG